MNRLPRNNREYFCLGKIVANAPIKRAFISVKRRFIS